MASDSPKNASRDSIAKMLLDQFPEQSAEFHRGKAALLELGRRLGLEKTAALAADWRKGMALVAEANEITQELRGELVEAGAAEDLWMCLEVAYDMTKDVA